MHAVIQESGKAPEGRSKTVKLSRDSVMEEQR